MMLLFIGPPGSGKGSQAKKMAEEFGFNYLSTGEMLREMKPNNPELARYMDTGELIPDDMLIKYFWEYVDEKKVLDNLILDGSPRTLYQYEKIASELEKRGYKLDHIIYLHIDDDTIVQRQSARRSDPITGKTYNLISNPPGPEVDINSLIQREDDKTEAIKNRIRVYNKLTKPLVDKLKAENKLMIIDGERPISVIYQELVEKLGLKKG